MKWSIFIKNDYRSELVIELFKNRIKNLTTIKLSREFMSVRDESNPLLQKTLKVA